MHSDLELDTVLKRCYLFLLIFFLGQVRFDYRWEFKEVLKRLSKQNKVRVWSEIGYQILGQV